VSLPKVRASAIDAVLEVQTTNRADITGTR